MADPLSKLFKDFRSMQNSACHSNQKEKRVKNYLADFNLAQMVLGWPSAKIVQIILIGQKHGHLGVRVACFSYVNIGNTLKWKCKGDNTCSCG